MFTRTARYDVVDNTAHGLITCGTVRTQIGTMRSLLARIEHLHRGLVSVQHAVLEQRFTQCVDQALQRYAAHADPLPQGRARQGQACACKGLFLTVQRQVIGVLGHQLLREQPGRRDTFVEHVGRHQRLDQRLALSPVSFAGT